MGAKFIIFACFQPILVFPLICWWNIYIDSLYIVKFDDIDKAILQNIDIDKGILQENYDM